MNVLEILGYVLLVIACLLGAALLLAIILIITTSVTVKLKYDGEAEIRIKYLWFTIVRSPKSPSQIKKEKKKALKELKKKEKLKRKNRQAAHLKTNKKNSSEVQKPKEVSSQTNEKKAEPIKGEKLTTEKTADKPSDKRKSEKKAADKKAKVDIQTAMGVINSAKPHIKKLFKKIRITDVLVDIMVGGDDAAKTAISYGVHCTAIYGLIEFLKRNITFDAKRITVKADFDLPKTDYYAEAEVKLKVSTLLGCLIWGFAAISKEMNKGSSQTGSRNNIKKPPLKKAG